MIYTKGESETKRRREREREKKKEALYTDTWKYIINATT